VWFPSPACWLHTLGKNIDLLQFPFARNKAKIFGKALAALDVKENTDNKESHIINDFSRRRIYMLYWTVCGEYQAHAEEKPKNKEIRQVTALSDKSESAMRTGAVQRHCGVN